MGYKQSQGNHILFFNHSSLGGVTTLIVYVDDIIVTRNNDAEKRLLSQCLSQEFEMKIVRRLKYFLGIEVAYFKNSIFLSQQKYVIDLLQETGKTTCKPVNSPISSKLICLAHIRPDIAYAVSVIIKFMHNPKQIHLQAAYHVLHFLKGITGKDILFKKHDYLALEVYTDVDYAGSIVDQRSTSGYCTFLGGNLITWRSKKQNVVSRSSAEAEFRAMAQGICEILWVNIILKDLKINIDGPMKLYCDNKSMINIAHNPIQHDRTKHRD
ncbi:unnamed protein product [Spirodela intermedia]|uniref:Reverse transcriptase Ty1/copia-type domain-containing protein n=1 Tax=Spirodela intermedia TaxID=51605 RepID=A0A7I8J6A0_SPIIN|nr:unnamed protein product [Spirodela intermedia]CAA6665275.1 unnamed protein product [Spirodela intermedia]